MAEINFLSQRRSIVTRTDQQDLKLKKYALIGFGIAVTVFFVSAGANIFFTNRLNQLATQNKAVTDQIAQDEPVEINFLVFAQKLKSVQEIYENRSNKQQAIDFFSNIFGGQVFLSGMSYEEGENALSLRLTSEDVFAFDNTLAILDSEEVKNVFSGVEKSSLRRDENGTYSLDISVELKTEREK